MMRQSRRGGRVQRVVIVLSLMWCFAVVVMAQPAGLEPGEAEARERAPTSPLITQWTHPQAEVRGIWLASRDMLLPKDQLREKLDAIQSANFNIVLIDSLFRGYVAYPRSTHLPQYPQFDGEDVFGWLVEQCHQRGLRAGAWMEYGFYAYFTPDASNDASMGPILDMHPELLSINFNGDRYIHRNFGDFYSLCPSNPRSHEILAQIMVEAVTKYPVDELNLDRIRYAGGDYCYCDHCRTHFHRETGIVLRPFSPDSDEAAKWLAWKREQTAKAVEHIVNAVRQAVPSLPITAYVVGPDEMNDKAQGWDLWMQRDLLDGIAVSMYGAEIESAAARARQLLGPAQAKLIGAISCEQQTKVFLSNIQRTRQLGMIGQYTWHFGEVADDIEALREGPYGKPAEPSLHPRR